MTLTEEEFNRVSKMNFRQILDTEPELVTRVINYSVSVYEIMISLGIGPTNSLARKSLKIFAEQRDIDLPSGRSKNLSENISATNLETTLLVKGKYIGTSLRKYVIRFNILEYSCSNGKCTLYGIVSPFWAGEELTLDLDHIDGDNTNNQKINLRFLCPNCHSQTKTYKGKNRAKKRKPTKDICSFCKVNEKKIESMRCKDCYFSFRLSGQTTRYPDIEEILSNISEIGVEPVAKEIGVTGNALKKYLGRRGFNVKDYSPYTHKKGK